MEQCAAVARTCRACPKPALRSVGIGRCAKKQDLESCANDIVSMEETVKGTDLDFTLEPKTQKLFDDVTTGKREIEPVTQIRRDERFDWV